MPETRIGTQRRLEKAAEYVSIFVQADSFEEEPTTDELKLLNEAVDRLWKVADSIDERLTKRKRKQRDELRPQPASVKNPTG